MSLKIYLIQKGAYYLDEQICCLSNCPTSVNNNHAQISAIPFYV